MRILCLGDSICYGYGVAPDKAWVSLVSRFDGLQACTFENAGVNGETAQEGMQRLPGLFSVPVPDVLYVQFGLNDAWQHVSVEEFIASLKAILCAALEQGCRALIVATNHPVCLTEEQGLYEGEAYREQVRVFNNHLREALIFSPDRIELVDMGKAFEMYGTTEQQARLLNADGSHLTEQGNRLYAETVYPVFMRALN